MTVWQASLALALTVASYAICWHIYRSANRPTNRKDT